MSSRNHRGNNHDQYRVGRRMRARRSAVLVEALEKRRMLTGAQPYVFVNTGIGGTGTDYWATIKSPKLERYLSCSGRGGTSGTLPTTEVTWQTISQIFQINANAQESAVEFTNVKNTHILCLRPQYGPGNA